MLLGDTPGSVGVRQIVLVDGCNAGNSFLRCAKCNKSCPSGEPPLHARRLNQSRLAGGEVTRRPVADPAAIRLDVSSLGHAEFRSRSTE